MPESAIEAKAVVSRPKAYLKVRQKNVRDGMKTLGLDGILLTHPPDLAYLTNFTGDDSVGLITEKDFFLATDFRYREQADLEAGWLKQYIREAKMADTLAKMLADAKAKRVGFEANFTTVGQVDALLTALKGENGAGNGSPVKLELVPLDDVMVNIRKVKDDT